MSRPRPEPVQVIKQRRDAALAALVESVPYIGFLGITFERRGDELTSTMHFHDTLIGNPMLPAIHGGATAAFLEVTSVITLQWFHLWPQFESGELDVDTMAAGQMPRLPKTIDFTVDYLRSGLPRDSYARATVNRSGRRYASVHVAAWQDHKDKLFAQATGHFLMPQDRRSGA
ncbi:PaaI family thioesterase [Tritonibacter mobilis]|uniref:PaaI family thioesterase n=1 Tax=Tritonibacter mobilis TaxID=379347 RepID=UPI0039A4D5A0